MEPRPIRMPDELWNALEEDAKSHNRMAAEHVRHICREYLEGDGEGRSVDDRLTELEQRLDRAEELEQYLDRVAELEQRVAKLESRIQEQGEPAEPAERGGERTQTAEQATERTSKRTAEPVSEGKRGSESEQQSASGTTATGRRASASESAESRVQQVDPEPIEDIEDVLVKARQEYGQYDASPEGKKRLAALKEALEHVRAEEKIPKDDLREALAANYGPAEKPEEVWWTETIQPGIQIAAEWGLVVSLSGGKFEWIGPPER